MKLMSKFEFRTWLSQLLFIVAGVLTYVAATNLPAITTRVQALMGYLSPFFAGIVIAYLLNIPCSRVERSLQSSGSKFVSKHARSISVAISYTVFISVVALLMRLLIPEVVRSVKEFALNFQIYFQNAVNYITEITNDESIARTLGYQSFISELSLKSIIDAIGYTSILQSIISILSVSTYLINILIAVVSSVYLLLEARIISAFFSKLIRAFVPDNTSAVLFRYLHKTNHYFRTFLYCTIIDALIIGAVAIGGLYGMGIQYAVILGIISGVTNMVPYFGAIVGSIIVVIIVLLTDGVGQAAAAGLFLFLLQQVDGNIIKVKLYGDSFKISPFIVLFSITIGGAYHGVLGMVIAIPFAAVVKSIIDDILEYRLKKNSAAMAVSEKGDVGCTERTT